MMIIMPAAMMMPLALSSANTAPLPQLKLAVGAAVDMGDAGSNVVHVDFTGGRSTDVRTAPKLDSKTRLPYPASAVAPSWKREVADRLATLHSLEAGWDGPGSTEIAAAAIARADRLLDVAFRDVSAPAPPAAVPCGDGSLQLEWRLTDIRFEVVIEPDGHLEAWALSRESGREFTAEGASAIELLFRWSSRLTADKLARQA